MNWMWIKGTRLLLTGTSALAVVSTIALFTSPVPAAAAAVSCTGTTTVNAAVPGVRITVPTVGNGTGNWHCELGIGNTSSAVKRLQIALNDTTCSFISPRLTVDGIYGPLTQQAVKQEQAIILVPIDGIYGPVTASQMLWPASGAACGALP